MTIITPTHIQISATLKTGNLQPKKINPIKSTTPSKRILSIKLPIVPLITNTSAIDKTLYFLFLAKINNKINATIAIADKTLKKVCAQALPERKLNAAPVLKV